MLTFSKATDEINFITVKTSDKLKECTSLLVKEINLLYEK